IPVWNNVIHYRCDLDPALLLAHHTCRMHREVSGSGLLPSVSVATLCTGPLVASPTHRLCGSWLSITSLSSSSAVWSGCSSSSSLMAISWSSFASTRFKRAGLMSASMMHPEKKSRQVNEHKAASEVMYCKETTVLL